MQWNCRGIRNKKELLILSASFDILLLSETWLAPSTSFFLMSFHIIRADRPSSHSGGLAICVRKGIPFYYPPSSSSFGALLEHLPVVVDSWYGKILIINVYRRPGLSLNGFNWSSLFTLFPDYTNILISGDFNAHHTAWGSSNNDRVGSSLLLSSSFYDFQLLNNKSPTFLSCSDQNPSALDLTFISASLGPITSWDVGEDTHGSDHLPTIIFIGCKPFKASRFSMRLRNHTIDWPSFHQILKDNLAVLNPSFPSYQLSLSSNNHHQNFESLPLPLKYDYLSDSISHAISSSQPFTTSSPSSPKSLFSKSHPPAFWWNPDCQTALINRRKALQRYRSHACFDNYIELKKCEAKAKKTFKSSKRTAWRMFCSSLNPKLPLPKLWRFVKNFKNRFLNSFESVSPTYLKDQSTLINNIALLLVTHPFLPITLTQPFLLPFPIIPLPIKNYLIS